MFTDKIYYTCLIYLFLVSIDTYLNNFGNKYIYIYSLNIGYHIWWIQVIFPVFEQPRRFCNSPEYV